MLVFPTNRRVNSVNPARGVRCEVFDHRSIGGKISQSLVVLKWGKITDFRPGNFQGRQAMYVFEHEMSVTDVKCRLRNDRLCMLASPEISSIVMLPEQSSISICRQLLRKSKSLTWIDLILRLRSFVR